MDTTYKADITLNEKDSLMDMLNLEKEIVKVYSTALTEGTSKGFRNLIKENFEDTANDQLEVFLMMTNAGYTKVQSAEKEQLKQEKTKFNKVKQQLN